MDCRQSLVVALAIALGSLGCVGTPTTTPVRPPPPATPPEVSPNAIRKEADGPKRAPKAATIASIGTHLECEAAQAEKSPAAQNQMRDQARRYYQDALQADPTYLPAYLGLARVYRDLGDYDRALDTYAKGLQRHPREVALWLDLGLCQARKKDFDQAIFSLQKAIELDPENRQAMQTLGFCLARAGRFEESLTCLTRIMGAAAAHLQVARMTQHLQQSGQLAPAVAQDLCRRHLQLALQANPNLAAARDMLSQLDSDPPRPQVTLSVRTEL